MNYHIIFVDYHKMLFYNNH